MKKLIVVSAILAILTANTSISAQDCEAYYPVREGAVREMKSYDKKDKLTGTVKQKVVSVEKLVNGMNIIINSESYDDKGEKLATNDMKMSCVDGIFTIDMKNFLDPSVWAGVQGMEVKIEAIDMEFPSQLSVGQQLKDASINLIASNMGMTMMKMNIKILERKVEAKEDITTPAGTFSCYKISYLMEVQSFGKYTAKGIDWYTGDVGAVRTESYDKNDKLTSYSILTLLEN
jgi:hypothetical protein